MSHKRQIFKSNILKKLLTEKNSCVSLVHGTRLLALPPFFLNDMKSGILYQLNTLLKKYDRSLGGIVIGYQNIKVLMDENTGIIPIGTSEIEVNISVEFYIFQPKIGSCLEGVINKKSNTHIGCLVHKYFNATILKPEEVQYEDWICKNFNVDDRIIFKVKDLDFTTLLPYIEGDCDGAELVKVSSEISENCDTDEINDSMKSDVNKSCQNEVLLSRELCKRTSNLSKDSNKHLNDKKVVKKKKVFKANEVTVNNEVEGNNSFTDSKVKKKKKKKEKALIQPDADDHIETKMECLPSEESGDDMLYSTQLEPSSVPKKMRIPFCSPIPSAAPFKPDNEIKIPETPGREPSNTNRREQELKKKHKKRKKEKKEEPEDSPPSKKRKISTDSSSKHEEVNKVDEKNSLVEIMMQQLCKQQLDRVKEELNMSSSDKESFKEEKKKKKKEKKPSKDIKESNNQISQLNGNDDKFIEIKTIFEKLWKEQVEKVKEELRTSEGKSFKESKKTKSKEKKLEKEKSKKKASEELKKTTNSLNNSTNGNEKKSEEQSLMDKIYRQEIDRVKAELNKSDTDNVKEKKKKKSSNKQESRKEQPVNSLYDRLLNDARSAIEFSSHSNSKKKKKTSN